MLRLTITAGDRIRHVPLRHDATLRVGSAADNEIVIDTIGVSRHHARIERTARGVTIVDTGSKNGIVFGSRRVQDVTLVPGDAVRLGAASVVVEEIATSDADLGMLLVGDSSDGALLSHDTETAAELASGPAAALQWARHVEQRTPREIARDLPALLEDARNIVRAEALLLVEIDGRDITIIAAAGTLPDDDEAAQLASGNAPAWLRAGRLAARMTSRGSWQREFLEFVDAKLHPATESRQKREAPALVLPPGMVAGTSAPMRALLADVERVAAGRIDVLLLGETGAGKELVAQAIHLSSARARAPFIAVNCAAVAKELLEAELFGIGRAVATGVEARPGLFAAAHGGTIFLDEIGEMPAALQPKLLRVLQEREVLAVGATKPRMVDVRVISSTNRDLGQLVTDGAFRPDLYYRLRGIELRVPPLRERREDIPPLVHAFARAAAAHKRIRGISRKALTHLIEFDWPGNVRELRNTIEAAVVRCPDGGTIQESHLALPAPSPPFRAVSPPSPDTTLSNRLEHAERDAILEAIRQSGGNKSRAAKLLGITRAGLYLKLKRYGIE
jgi:DNA-binding NtrC family response regulator